MESIDIIIRAVNRAKTTLNEVGRELKDVGQEAKKLDKDTSKKAVAGLRQWRGELEKTKKSVKSLHDASQSIVDVSKKLLMAGAAMGAAVFFPIKQAGEFESAMAKVRAIMTDVSEETFERMKAQARSLGETTQYTATQSAEAFTFLAMAGLSAAEAMEALPGTLQLAAAGGLELAVAADLATNVLAGLGFEVDELGRVNDVLARAASRANTSVWQLGEAMKIAGPAAKGSKEEFEAIVAVLGGMADAGIKGGEAGNAVKRMLILLQNPTAKARTELAKLNVPLTDSEGKFRGLIPILQDLGEAQMDLSASAKIFGLYTGAAAIAAAGSAEKMGVLAEELRNATGAAEEMARVMLDTMPGALTLLKSAVEGLMLSVAGPLLGLFKDILITMADMVSMVTALVKITGPVAPMVFALVTALAGLVLAVGALGIVVGGVVYGFAQWTLVMKMIAPTLALIRGVVVANIASMTTLAGVMGMLKVVVLALGRALIAHPILAIGAALVSVYLYIKQLVPEWKRLNEKAERLRKESDKISATFERMYDAFKKTTKGSKEQTEAAIKLKDKLEELAKENESISEAAFLAADSIDRATGRILDGGKALEKFDLALVGKEFKAMAAEAIAASAKMEATLKKVTFPTTPLRRYIWGLQDLNSLFFSMVPGIDTLTDRYDNMGKQATQAMKDGKAFAESQVRELIRLQHLDPSLGLRQFQTYIKSLGPMSEQMLSFYLDAFMKIKASQIDNAQSGTDIIRRSLDEQNILFIRQADQRESILLKLQKRYEDARAASKVDSSNIAIIEARNRAYREGLTAVDNYVKAIETLRDNEIAITQEIATTKLRIIEDEVHKGLLAKEQGELEKVRIVAEGAKAEADILMASSQRVMVVIGKSTGAYSKMSAAAKKAANEAYEAQAVALDKYEEKLRSTYEKARNEVKKYAEEVIRWEQKIAELSMSTEDKIRSAKRKTMTEHEQWLDKQKQAEEKLQAARAAFAGGDFPLAEKMAKQAESLYGDLATKIEEGVGKQREVTLSIEEGTDAAIRGYGKVKAVLEDVYNAQKDIAEDSKTEWERAADSVQSALEDIIYDRKMAIDLKLEGAVAAEEEIAELTRDRKVYITPVIKEKIGGFINKFASGGRLPGFGGGDKINALLEAGEFIIRKEAVQKYGTRFFDMWNSMKIKTSDINSTISNRLQNLTPSLPHLGYQTGGLVQAGGLFENVQNLGRVELVIGNAAYPILGQVNVIKELMAALEKENLLRTK